MKRSHNYHIDFGYGSFGYGYFGCFGSASEKLRRDDQVHMWKMEVEKIVDRVIEAVVVATDTADVETVVGVAAVVVAVVDVMAFH